MALAAETMSFASYQTPMEPVRVQQALALEKCAGAGAVVLVAAVSWMCFLSYSLSSIFLPQLGTLTSSTLSRGLAVRFSIC